MVLRRPVKLAPFLGTWPRLEVIWPTTLDSLRSGLSRVNPEEDTQSDLGTDEAE
jgi:hypothetical protein